MINWELTRDVVMQRRQECFTCQEWRENRCQSWRLKRGCDTPWASHNEPCPLQKWMLVKVKGRDFK